MNLKILYVLVFIFAIVSLKATAQENMPFRFNKEGLFRVAQFTDIHWNDKSPNCAETTATIKYILETEKPDIAFLTGDVVSDKPAKEGWMSIAKIFSEAKMPWAVLLGNHDAEQGYTRRQLFEMLDGLPYYVGQNGPETLTGSGNYVLPILASGDNEKIVALLYGIDSNDYPSNPKNGHYDWIHADQIDWFRLKGKEYKIDNTNKSLPSLVFFHIPIPEFKKIVGQETTVGIQKEGVASPEINSGFFCAMLEQGGVMGAFVGHDHDNDYVGLYHDIALGFGRVTGANAYGQLERGSRIILMYENQNKFDTWIRTKLGPEFTYYYPSGLSEVDEETMEYLPAKEYIVVKEQGVEYTYYEGGRMKKIADIKTVAKAKKNGFINNFSLIPALAKDSFAFEYRTLIDIPEKGVYRFYTNSDDGSQLFIDDILIVDNDGSHNSKRVNGKVALEAGLHQMRVVYFEDYMGELLEVGWSSRHIEEGVIPDSVLFVPQKIETNQ